MFSGVVIVSCIRKRGRYRSGAASSSASRILVDETARRFNHHVDDEFATARRYCQLLLLPFPDRLPNAPRRVLTHVRASVQQAVDGRHAEARLQRDFLDQKGMTHRSLSESAARF
nr:hypothetical protein [Paraburkholderia hospita]